MSEIITLEIIQSPAVNNKTKINVSDFPFTIGRKDVKKVFFAPDIYLDSPNKELGLSHFTITKNLNKIFVELLDAEEIILTNASQGYVEKITEQCKKKEIESGTEIKAGDYTFKLYIERFDPNRYNIFCVQCQKNEIYVSPMNLNEGNLADFKCRECKKNCKKNQPKLKIKCKICDKDLTDSANKDNRAFELRDYVEYMCDECVNKEIGSSIHPNIGIDDFRIIRLLGKGGFGEVFKVQQIKTKRILALKTKEFSIDEDENYTREVIKQLKKDFREIFVSSYIESKDFVKLIDATWKNQKIYLIFEYMDKGNLDDFAYFKNSPDFSVKSLREYIITNICPVLDGLEYIHTFSRPSGENYVHRDIKPQNILIKSNKKNPLVKIGDLGTTKDFRGAGFSDITVGTDLPIMSLQFAPPEQIEDYIHPTPLNDVYSLGATLYYLLTRQFPLNFIENSWDNYKFNTELIVKESRIPIKERENKIPDKLAIIIDKSLELDPEKRFSSAKEFKEALLNASI